MVLYAILTTNYKISNNYHPNYGNPCKYHPHCPICGLTLIVCVHVIINRANGGKKNTHLQLNLLKWSSLSPLPNMKLYPKSFKNFLQKTPHSQMIDTLTRWNPKEHRNNCWALWSLVVFDPEYNPIRNKFATVFNGRFSEALSMEQRLELHLVFFPVNSKILAILWMSANC